MTIEASLESWNEQVLLLSHALVESISPNFRQVTLDLEEDGWLVTYYLEKEIEEDIEEVEEISCQYSSNQGENILLFKGRDEIVIGSQRLPGYREVGRIVYRRRERAPDGTVIVGEGDKPLKRLTWDTKTLSWKEVG